jgi:hypothetical protein
MKLEVYQILGISSNKLFEKREEMYSSLKKTSEYKDDRGLKFCINNLDFEENIISGTISQEYIGDLYTVENKVDTPIQQNPWEKTYFFVDTTLGKILLQKRRYSPKNLNHGKTETRLVQILNLVCMNLFGGNISIVKTSIGDNNEYFKKIIEKEKIEFLKVGNLLGKKIKVGTKLHNPREDWDKVWAESWNTYDSEIVEEIDIRVTKGQDLKKSVIKNGTLAAEGSQIKVVRYYDTELERSVTLSKKSVGAVDIDAKLGDEPATIYKKAIKKIKNSRDVIKKLNIDI